MLARVPERLAPILPAPCGNTVQASLLGHWPRGTPAARREEGAVRCLVEVAVVPSFLSPFRWQVIAQLSDGYRTLDMNLLDDRDTSGDGVDASWRRAADVPNQWTPAVDAGGGQRTGEGLPGLFALPGDLVGAARQ